MELGGQGHAQRIMWITLTTLPTFQIDKKHFPPHLQKKGSKKKGRNSVSENKKSVPCPNHAAGLGNAASTTADEEDLGSNVFQGHHFIQTLDSSIFPDKNGHVNLEDNENDDESSLSDPELCPIKDLLEPESVFLKNSSP